MAAKACSTRAGVRPVITTCACATANPRAMDDLVSILRSREPLYARADATLDTAGHKVERSLADLVALTASQPGR